jgi:hypothetical protein
VAQVVVEQRPFVARVAKEQVMVQVTKEQKSFIAQTCIK